MASQQREQKAKKRTSPLGTEELVGGKRRAAVVASSVSDPDASTQASSSRRSSKGGRSSKPATWQEVYERNGAAKYIPWMEKQLEGRDLNDDPPIVFDWHTERLLQAMQAYAGAVPRPPFLAPVNLALVNRGELLHSAFTQHVSRNAVLAARHMHGTVGMSCTGTQYAEVVAECGYLLSDAYFIDLALNFPTAFPIATIYSLKPRTTELASILTQAAAVVGRAPLWG